MTFNLPQVASIIMFTVMVCDILGDWGVTRTPEPYITGWRTFFTVIGYGAAFWAMGYFSHSDSQP